MYLHLTDKDGVNGNDDDDDDDDDNDNDNDNDDNDDDDDDNYNDHDYDGDSVPCFMASAVLINESLNSSSITTKDLRVKSLDICWGDIHVFSLQPTYLCMSIRMYEYIYEFVYEHMYV